MSEATTEGTVYGQLRASYVAPEDRSPVEKDARPDLSKDARRNPVSGDPSTFLVRTDTGSKGTVVEKTHRRKQRTGIACILIGIATLTTAGALVSVVAGLITFGALVLVLGVLIGITS